MSESVEHTAENRGVAGSIPAHFHARISPVEPYWREGELLFGAMAWSLKVRDLRRDPRCVLHSAISGPSAGEGELKLYGRATEADDRVRNACTDAWWAGRPRESAVVFSVTIDEAAFIDWDLRGGEMVTRHWGRDGGVRVNRRSYP